MWPKLCYGCRMRRLIWFSLYAAACVFLVLGLSLPIIRFDRLYFFRETPSLVELVSALWGQGDVALALIVGLFSIVFPITKLMALGVQAFRGDPQPGFFARVMPHLAKWSMMDVMLVALVVFAAKTSGLAQAVTQPGLWFYAASAIIAGILPQLARREPSLSR